MEKGFGKASEKTALIGHLGKPSPPVITYDPEKLTHWRALVELKGTVFMQPAVLCIIAGQFFIVLVVATALYYLVEHPEKYKSNAMKDLIQTVAVSIAFLLGLFLSACINRWWDTVRSLEGLFGTIKRLTMTAINLELPENCRLTIARQSVLSTYLLELEEMEIHAIQAGHATKEVVDAHWTEVFDHWESNGMMTNYERRVFHKVPQQQRSFFAWTLVSKGIREHRHMLLVADGSVDVMAYDRICDLIQSGVANISSIKTAAAFKMPYIYVHMLAFMIHFVNVMTAVGTGVRIGLMVATSRQDHTPVNWNSLGSALIFLGVQAFIYQAFLTIGADLSFPITGSAYRVPLKDMCIALDGQLKLMNHLADKFDEEDEGEVVPWLRAGS